MSTLADFPSVLYTGFLRTGRTTSELVSPSLLSGTKYRNIVIDSLQ
jgi:hypothetical protein